MEKRYIYLDHSATTPVDPQVLDAMLPYFNKIYGNASSLHSLGRRSREAIEQSRAKIAGLLNASPTEIIFTGGGTESDNIAILGTARALSKYGKHLITSEYEHPAVKNAFKKLITEGFDVTFIKPNSDGIIEAETVERAIREDTVLVSIMHVNNEIGTINPIRDIARITSSRDIIFHTDAVQSFGKIPINAKIDMVDLISASSHKIYGPKGVGLLYIRNAGLHKKYGRFIRPILFGGGHEFGYRPSTENVPGIVGFVTAAELAHQNMELEWIRLLKIRDRFIYSIKRKIPEVIVNGSLIDRLPHNINLSFKGIDGNKLLNELDKYGIEVSTGSACHLKTGESSYVLRAIGVPEEIAQGSIRITMGRDTTEEDMEYVKEKLIEIVQKLRKEGEK